MPLPPALARFNRAATNRLTRWIAPWAPGFGIVTHRGRRSGTTYTTPVNVFRTRDGFSFALTYGMGDWVQNVLHDGTAQLTTRRHRYTLTGPHLVHDPQHTRFPLPVRMTLRLIHADDALDMTAAAA